MMRAVVPNSVIKIDDGVQLSLTKLSDLMLLNDAYKSLQEKLWQILWLLAPSPPSFSIKTNYKKMKNTRAQKKI